MRRAEQSRWQTLLVTCCCLGLWSAAAGAVVPAIPGPAQIEQFDKRMQEAPPPLPAATTDLEVSPPPLAEEMPAGAEKIKFTLKKLQIEGATVYTPEALRGFYAPYLGKTITLGTVYRIAALLTQHYRHDGYVLSRVLVPAQEIDNGTVRLQVVEGYVARIVVPEKQDNRIIEYFIQRVKMMRPLHQPTLERMLLALNDLPGIQLHTTLLPISGKNAPPGAVMMKLDVTRKIAGGQISFGNDGSRYIGPWQGSATAWLVDQILPFDQLSLRVLTPTHTQEIRYGEVQYHAPVNANGTSAGFFASTAHSVPGFTLAPLEIVSDASTLRGELSQVLLRSRAESLTVTAGLEHKEIATDTLHTELYRDRLNVISGKAQFSDADSWGGVNSLDVNLRQGLNILGTRRTGSLDLSRSEGHSDFTLVNTLVSRLQPLGGPWQLNLAATGQYAWSPLLASEQFGFGGPAFGRAYDPSELTGDSGIAASAELRYNSFRTVQYGYGLNLIPFLYYDVGKVWNISTGGEPDSAASGGGGVIIRSDSGPQLTLTVADPLTRAQDNPLTGNGKSPRWLAEFSQQF